MAASRELLGCSVRPGAVVRRLAELDWKARGLDPLAVDLADAAPFPGRRWRWTT